MTRERKEEARDVMGAIYVARKAALDYLRVYGSTATEREEYAIKAAIASLNDAARYAINAHAET